MNADAIWTLQHSPDGGIGVAKTIRKTGDGEKPQMGEKIRVKYMGMLDDGTVFASSATKKRGDVIEITLGMREMWGTGGDIGLASMRPGERAMITCHNEFGFGAGGVSEANIPPNARLTFDVELHEVVKPNIKRQFMIELAGFCFFLLLVFLFLYHHGHIHPDGPKGLHGSGKLWELLEYKHLKEVFG